MRTVAMGLVAVLALIGCTSKKSEQTTPQPSPMTSSTPSVTAVSPSPSPSPSVFESFPPAPADESKDQAAIRTAWMQYWTVYQKFASNPRGYTDFTETQQVTTGEASNTILSRLQILREKGLRSGGGMKFVNVAISIPTQGEALRTATVSYCIDPTHFILYDAEGKKAERDNKALKEVATMQEMKDGTWRVSMTIGEFVDSCRR